MGWAQPNGKRLKTSSYQLPLPGILTGAILSLSRAIGETAPLVVIGIPALLLPFPGGIFDKFTVLPMQIYYWTLDSSLGCRICEPSSRNDCCPAIRFIGFKFDSYLIRNKFQKRY